MQETPPEFALTGTNTADGPASSDVTGGLESAFESASWKHRLRLCRSCRGDGEDMPLAGYAFELVSAAVFELES